MNSLRQFADLNARDRQLLLWAFLLVAGVRLVLWTVPFRFARRSTKEMLAAQFAKFGLRLESVTESIHIVPVMTLSIHG